LPVCEALAFHTFDSGKCAINVAVAKARSVIVPEIKFREITMQMLLFAMLIDDLHAAFKDRKHAFNRVRMYVTT
jgi:hypothetical protein